VEPKLVLASGSPRRAGILQSLGVRFRVREAELDEALLPGEGAASAAERLARAKAALVARSESLPVLAADTVVTCEGRVFGKPGSAARASEMLRALRARSHEVISGVCLASAGSLRSAVARTTVVFAPMSEEQIAWYVATGEPLDKAGAYHIEGRGALFVASVSGSPSNVAGLPVELVYRLAREARVDIGLP
jgi:septum formation protein